MSATILGPDGRPRCRWCAAAPEFLAYHDTDGARRGQGRARRYAAHPSRSETKLYHQTRHDGRYGAVPNSLNNIRA